MAVRRRGRGGDDEVPAAPEVGIHTAALRLLGRRDYTEHELAAKLTDRGYPRDDVDAELVSLRDSRALDDRRVGAAHVRTAARIKRRGRLRIARELEARGLDRGLIQELLTELPAEDDAAAIGRILEQRRVPAVLDPAARQRVFNHLLRRGFPAEAISRALRGRTTG
jgi:regulatory protein